MAFLNPPEANPSTPRTRREAVIGTDIIPTEQIVEQHPFLKKTPLSVAAGFQKFVEAAKANPSVPSKVSSSLKRVVDGLYGVSSYNNDDIPTSAKSTTQ